MVIELDLHNILKDLDETKIIELREQLDNFYPQDIADEYSKLEEEEQRQLFDILSFSHGAKVLVELENHEIKSLIEKISDKQLVRFANEMDLDDAADIIGLLDDSRVGAILEAVQKQYKLKELLSYEPDSCGGRMSPHFLSVRADLKIAAALRYVRIKAREDQNEITYIYVTTANGELVGVLSLRELFMAPDGDPVSEHMHTDTISVEAEEDQEVAADIINKYRFLVVPVTNSESQIVGIITIDDIVDVIEEETTEDIYQSSGINVDSAEDISTRESIFRSYKSRTPWLVITLMGQFIAAMLIAQFENTVSAIPIAISFMPLLSGMSGNIGNQSVTIVVRGIYTGDINVNEAFRVLKHEIFTSFGIGITCASITGYLAFMLYKNSLLALLIGISLIVSMALAVGLGTTTPFIFKRLNLDPATASGPLITTLIDVISFLVYLTLITRFTQALI